MLDFTSVSLETQLAWDNRPAINASFLAGNNGSGARDGTRASQIPVHKPASSINRLRTYDE